MIEILIIGRDVLSTKTLSLLSEKDYVLVDEVSLIAQVLVIEECCTIGRLLAYRQKNSLSFKTLSENNIKLVNILKSCNLVVIRCIKLDSH